MDNSKLWTSAKFFERLDFFLSAKNWTLYQLCSDVDITVDAIYKMRRRNTLPSLQSVCIICDALGLSLAEFFSVEILSPDCKAIMDSFETISNQSLSALAILVQHLNLCIRFLFRIQGNNAVQRHRKRGCIVCRFLKRIYKTTCLHR